MMNIQKTDSQKSILLQRLQILKIRNLIFFIFYLLFNPSVIKGFFKGIYLPTLIQYQIFKKYNIRTFIDVGSYTGEDSKVIRYLFPKSKIIAFEPDTNNYNFIKRNLKIGNFTLYNVALSDKKGKVDFYSHPLSALSSLFRLSSKKVLKDDYVYQKTTKYSVKTEKIDSILKNTQLKGQVLLKIDTQGAEDIILKGAKETLKRVDIIHVETCIEHIYKDQSDFGKIYSILLENGFTFVGEARESEFYPIFELKKCFNSIFIKNKILKAIY